MDDLVVDTAQVQLSLMDGELDFARRWFDEGSMIMGKRGIKERISRDYMLAHMRKYEELLLARLRIAEGRPLEPELLEAALPEFERIQRRAIIEGHLLRLPSRPGANQPGG
jgi:hypothetical protein